MFGRLSNHFRLLVGASCVILVAACTSSHEENSSSLSLQLPGESITQTGIRALNATTPANSSNQAYGYPLFTASGDPNYTTDSTSTTLRTLNCYFIVVAGNGPGMQSSSCQLVPDPASKTGALGTQFPVGKIYGPFSAGNPVNINGIPSGTDTIMLVGFYSSNGCPSVSSGVLGFESNTQNESAPIIVAPPVQASLQPGSSATVEIDLYSTLQANQQIQSCTGPELPAQLNPTNPNQGGGPPAKVALITQDDLTSFYVNTTPALAFQLLDANNAPASVPTGTTINISVIASASGFLNLPAISGSGGGSLNVSFTSSSISPTYLYLTPSNSGDVSFSWKATSTNLGLSGGTVAVSRFINTTAITIQGTNGFSCASPASCRLYLLDLSTLKSIPISNQGSVTINAGKSCSGYLIEVHQSSAGLAPIGLGQVSNPSGSLLAGLMTPSPTLSNLSFGNLSCANSSPLTNWPLPGSLQWSGPANILGTMTYNSYNSYSWGKSIISSGSSLITSSDIISALPFSVGPTSALLGTTSLHILPAVDVCSIISGPTNYNCGAPISSGDITISIPGI